MGNRAASATNNGNIGVQSGAARKAKGGAQTTNRFDHDNNSSFQSRLAQTIYYPATGLCQSFPFYLREMDVGLPQPGKESAQSRQT